MWCFCRPTERELTERQIKTSLREIMMQKDLENVTCKEVLPVPIRRCGGCRFPVLKHFCFRSEQSWK